MACLSGKVALIQLSFLSPVSCLVATHRWKHWLFFFSMRDLGFPALCCKNKGTATAKLCRAATSVHVHHCCPQSLSGEPPPPLFSSPLPNLLHHFRGMILTKSDIALPSGHRPLWIPLCSCHGPVWSNPQMHQSRSPKAVGGGRLLSQLHSGGYGGLNQQASFFCTLLTPFLPPNPAVP